jgi:hypothetical protein
MQPFAFCNRCRGMKVGWNRRYIKHSLVCQEWLSKAFKTTVLTGLLSSFVFAFPVSTGVVKDLPTFGIAPTVDEVSAAEDVAKVLAQVEGMFIRHGVDKERFPRVVRAIMASSAKYGVDPRLVASIAIVESGANPFAVSSADSVGIMQIHLGTWGEIADNEDINLFKVEDNVDFGVRILRDYIVASDIWEGVARYCGRTATPESQQAAAEYVQKVQRLYGYNPPKASLQ